MKTQEQHLTEASRENGEGDRNLCSLCYLLLVH